MTNTLASDYVLAMNPEIMPDGFAAADDVSLAYYRTGSGPPLLLINGGPGFPARHFAPLAQMLADHLEMEVIRFDQRGTGGSTVSDASVEAFAFDRLVDDIDHLRRRLQIADWVVLGHSFGALLAAGFTARYPAATRLLILSAPAGVDGGFMARLEAGIEARLSAAEREAVAALTDKPQDYQRRLDVLSILMAAYVYDKANLPALRRAVVDSRIYVPEVSAQVWKNLDGFDLRPNLRTISGPVLVLQGDDDPIGPETIDQICEVLPDAFRRTIPKCRHYPWIDNPRPYLAAISDAVTRLS